MKQILEKLNWPFPVIDLFKFTVQGRFMRVGQLLFALKCVWRAMDNGHWITIDNKNTVRHNSRSSGRLPALGPSLPDHAF